MLYHITPLRKVEGIIENGLENRNGRGICVVVTNHDLIIFVGRLGVDSRNFKQIDNQGLFIKFLESTQFEGIFV